VGRPFWKATRYPSSVNAAGQLGELGESGVMFQQQRLAYPQTVVGVDERPEPVRLRSYPQPAPYRDRRSWRASVPEAAAPPHEPRTSSGGPEGGWPANESVYVCLLSLARSDGGWLFASGVSVRLFGSWLPR
jgi:hypothetical protein